MRKRLKATPRLEDMEERVVPSFLGISEPHWVTTEIHSIGNAIGSYTKSAKNYLETLNQQRSGQPKPVHWPTKHATATHTSNTLFGIPWLKI